MSEFPVMRQVLPSELEIPDREALEEVYRQPEGRHIRVNFVASLDGVIEVDGRSEALGGPADRVAFMAMRAVADAVMAGAGTVRAENYGPVKLLDEVRARRERRGDSALPRLVVVSARGDLAPDAKVFSGPERPLLLTTLRVSETRPDLHDAAEVLVCGDERVDLEDGMDALAAKGLRRVLCEGGPSLFRSLLGAGLVDELALTFAPLLAGSQYRHLSGTSALPTPEEFELARLLIGAGMLLTCYRHTGADTK